MNGIEQNLAEIRERMEAAAARFGYPAPTLVCVTKSATPEEFLALVALGVGDIAENRVPMFREKEELLSGTPYHPALHLIGSLQTNKVKYIIGKTRLIQSLDSERLAAEIDRLSQRAGIVTDVLVEINSGREAQKGGILPEDAAAFTAAVSALPGIRVCGLMTMGPASPDPEGLRPCFRETRSLFLSMKDQGLFASDSPILSMGMSESYIVAAEEGATMVRIGRALFAPRGDRKDEIK